MSNESNLFQSRIKLLLLASLFIAPVAASYLFYYFWTPAGQTNYGELLPPRLIPEQPLRLVDGNEFQMNRLKGKWILLQVDSGHCDAWCEKKLYYMRQIRKTQGKDMERVENVWLIEDGIKPNPSLESEYRGVWMVKGLGSDLLKAFPANDNIRNHIYIIDPIGNLMMRYPRDPDPRKMIKDLTKLLRVSRIG